MRTVIIGGTGLIGAKLVTRLVDEGHDAVAASPSSGVDTITGAGLSAAMKGADVVVDVSNSPSFEGNAAVEFFETSSTNLLAAEADAGVRHHLVLSIVGVERLAEGAYFRGKIAQEAVVAASPVPYTIVRATQFFEFLDGIADRATQDTSVLLPPAMFQPIAVDDVVEFVSRTSKQPAVRRVIEVAGPRPHRLDELVRDYLIARGDPRVVITDPDALYSGARLGERALLPGSDASLTDVGFEDWLSANSVPS